MDEEKKGVGQPTKYKPEYCEMLIEHMAEGYSFESFAAKTNASRISMFRWVKEFPEFAEAKEMAFDKCQLFWEKKGIDNIVNISESETTTGIGGTSNSRSLNSATWIFNMVNRFKWRHKQADETDVIVNNNNTNVNGMSDEELDKKIAEKMKKATADNDGK